MSNRVKCVYYSIVVMASSCHGVQLSLSVCKTYMRRIVFAVKSACFEADGRYGACSKLGDRAVLCLYCNVMRMRLWLVVSYYSV